MRKRILSLILCICLFTSLLTGMVFADGLQFADVAADAYYAKAVQWAVEKGITNGTSATTFSPNQTCTRAHIITFLWRAAGCPKDKLFGSFNPFFDIEDESAYYYEAAKWALGNMIVLENNFKPNDPCTRASTVEFFWRAAGCPDADPVPFKDVQSGSQLETAVSWALRNGVTNGTSDTTFSPNQTVTRGQIVTFLYRQYVSPLDNTALIKEATSNPKSDLDEELDPLPPEDYRKTDEWYKSLTPVKEMSNVRLVAEVERLQATLTRYDVKGIFYNELVTAREEELLKELNYRSSIIICCTLISPWLKVDESVYAVYDELIEKYGPPDPILQWRKEQ